MLYSGENGNATSFRGKTWKLSNGYTRACNYKGQQCTFKIKNEALRFAAKDKPVEVKPLNEAFSLDDLEGMSTSGLRRLLASWQKREKASPHNQPIADNIEAIKAALAFKQDMGEDVNEGPRQPGHRVSGKAPKSMPDRSAFDAIKAGSRVTIKTPQGQTRRGKAVMYNRQRDSWVLNMGGRHGTPGVVTRDNFVSLGGGGKGMGRFSDRKEGVKEAMGSNKPVTVYAKDRKTVLGTVSKQSSSVGASKVAGGSVQQVRVNGYLSWVLKEGLKRQQTRYRPELSRSEMEQLVANLKKQGYKATAKGPNLKTDATDKAIDMAEAYTPPSGRNPKRDQTFEKLALAYEKLKRAGLYDKYKYHNTAVIMKVANAIEESNRINEEETTAGSLRSQLRSAQFKKVRQVPAGLRPYVKSALQDIWVRGNVVVLTNGILWQAYTDDGGSIGSGTDRDQIMTTLNRSSWVNF